MARIAYHIARRGGYLCFDPQVCGEEFTGSIENPFLRSFKTPHEASRMMQYGDAIVASVDGEPIPCFLVKTMDYLSSSRERIAELETSLERESSLADYERQKVVALVEAGTDAGWNGVTNSKSLAQFIRNMASEVAFLRDWNRKAADKLREVSSPGYCGDPHIDQDIAKLLKEAEQWTE